MCGIAGYAGAGADGVKEEVFRAAVDSMRRRGPDDAGLWSSKGIWLGHRRLAVLDISRAGHQPMVSHDGRYVVVYNGEIYNFFDLKKELPTPQGGWKSHSDTEMLLEAYRAWGVECLTRFHGMFAFALWDCQDKVLFAARDRMGVKPFYYAVTPEGLAFASRPRVLETLLPSQRGDLDVQALRLYLEAGFIPAPLAFHQGIRKLPPAHYLLWRDGTVSMKRYWNFHTLSPLQEWNARPEEDLLDELDAILTRSVQARLVSDVPLGAFLSGGIDSSLVVALMRKGATGPVRTFTIGFEEKENDESAHAAAVARHLETEHHAECFRSDDLVALLDMFLEEYDEPFFDTSAFATMAVSRLARRHVTVSLSGDGGDELFGGYPYYEMCNQLESVFHAPALVRGALARILQGVPDRRGRLLGAALAMPGIPEVFATARGITKDFRGVLSREVLGSTRSLRDIFAETARTFPRGLRAAEQAMRLDALYTLPDDYLQKVDVASMAFSLESREPLLDQELVEWATRLPLSWKYRHGVNKYLLRRLAYRYVPQRLLDRPKQGFGVPVGRWLKGPLKSWVQERFDDPQRFQGLPLDQQKARALWQSYQGGQEHLCFYVWALLLLVESVARRRGCAGR